MKTISVVIILLSVWSYNCDVKIEHNFNEVFSPYRTLKIAPWSSMKEIREQYERLRRNANSVVQDDLDQAMHSIKKERKEGNYDEDERLSFLSFIWSLIWKTFLFESVFGLIALLFYMLNRFQNLLSSPLFFVVLAFELVSKLIPYYFESSMTQYIFSLFIGMIFYCLKELLNKVINAFREKGKQSSDEKDKIN